MPSSRAPLRFGLAWLLAEAVITSPIIGATSIERLNENLEIVDVKLAAKEMGVSNKMTEWENEE